MTLRIRHYPDPVLRQPAAAVGEITDEIKELAAAMFAAMRAANGIGLAAPQVGVSLRLLVADVPPATDEIEPLGEIVLINPEIIGKSKDKETVEEGCLSFPEVLAKVRRPLAVRVRALNLAGEEIVIEATGLLARCLQHEIDHLDGVLFPDRVSLAGKLSIKGGLRELENKYAASTDNEAD